MLKKVKRTARQTVLYDIVRRIRGFFAMGSWKRRGRPVPPPHFVKQRIVRTYAKRFSAETLVETGTYLGEMVDAMRRVFGEIYSIELDKALCEDARERFASLKHISILHGESSAVLPTVLSNIAKTCLFWLDGHYSGGVTARGEMETPIIDELRSILRHPIADHVILIDDARCFGRRKEYPRIEELRQMVQGERPDWVFEIEDDIIRIHKRTSQ